MCAIIQTIPFTHTIKMPPAPLKDKFERVKDAVEILTKLQEFGVPISEPGYKKTKEHLDAWIADGDRVSVQIPFVRIPRTAHMTLPKEKGASTTYVLKATDAAQPT